MRNLYLLSLLCLCTFATGCASIVSGSNQSLSVEARQKGAPVVAANCKLTNDKGSWFVTTPGSVTVHRSYDDLSIRCEKDGVDPGLVTAKSSTKALAFGNILLGGIIGGGVDVATGAAYDYPVLITIEMGATGTLPAVAVAAAAPATPDAPQPAPANPPAAAPAPTVPVKATN